MAVRTTVYRYVRVGVKRLIVLPVLPAEEPVCSGLGVVTRLTSQEFNAGNLRLKGAAEEQYQESAAQNTMHSDRLLGLTL